MLWKMTTYSLSEFILYLPAPATLCLKACKEYKTNIIKICSSSIVLGVFVFETEKQMHLIILRVRVMFICIFTLLCTFSREKYSSYSSFSVFMYSKSVVSFCQFYRNEVACTHVEMVFNCQ